MISSLLHAGMWLLPALPADDIYDALKPPINPVTNKPYEKIRDNRLQEKVKAEMQTFLDKVGIRKDLEIIETRINDSLCAAQGSNSFKNGGVVVCCPGFHEIDNQAFQFVFKHEISHLKNNDEFGIAVAQTISFIASIVFFHLGLGLGPIYTSLSTLAVNVLATGIFRHYLENRADKFAIQHATSEELKGGLCLLKAMQLIEDGFSFFHPSVSSRIKNIEKAMSDNQISYHLELDRVNQLKDLIEANEKQ